MRWVIVPLCLILAGCGAGFGAESSYYPITDGFTRQDIQKSGRMVVWGGHPSANGTAVTWLQKRGYTVVERGKLTQLLNEQAIRLSSSPDDEAAVLKVGKLTGAREVVFLDSPIKEQTWSASTAGYYGWYGGQSQTQSGVAYQVSVSVRGVDVESGEVLWSGTAHYAAMVTDLDNRLRLLTCHALSTAWGLRPTGTARITRESICERDSQP